MQKITSYFVLFDTFKLKCIHRLYIKKMQEWFPVDIWAIALYLSQQTYIFVEPGFEINTKLKKTEVVYYFFHAYIVTGSDNQTSD